MRSISTAYIGTNTITDMKKIEAEGGLKHEVGFVGIISESREIRLTSSGISYSKKTADGWSYDLQQAIDYYQNANPNTKIFLTGHSR